MAGLLDLCEKYFGARDFYEVLKIPTNANEKQVKKAYHKLSLLVHPDRVEENVKAEATEKFKVLGRIHSILSDNDKRKIYDESGQFDEESEEVVMKNWADYWRSLFKEITVEDINNYEKNYKGSETEIKDLKRAYMDSKGDMDYILEAVPFTNCAEEPRLHDIVQELIETGDVPEFKAFTEEDPKKKIRRKRKWAKEAAEAEKLEKMLKIENEENAASNALSLAIQNRGTARAKEANNFFDSLVEKYANKAGKPSKAKSPKGGRIAKSPRKTKKKA
ncbi:dnaJ homolog subfamily C member 9 [Neodiprion pinetum]|uniref:DnaJ homolog subfamily C member 9 n=1 Tax=Neodiprion lecontei TaxID=441921 RepID=A0A6J0BLA8_NEOLC|nr:dnaJ homolog subfamily C member 9 [Neodiprion lecontei]XP_046418783.1 dnaJ homolog subfamily C member 9 [Neodiprion fabricii]XP_046474655.1 dnaJ homolog subfamily C member 9 [Neodiprion pinetum]XP_046612364.1 dnaJ homolog subfamily C member 9 [Neodiprion virginianus]